MRELSNEVLEEMNSAGRIILSPSTPIDAKDNSLWFKTGIGDSESGTLLGGGGSDTTQTIVKNAQMSENEPDNTIDAPFWFKVVDDNDNI